MSDLPVETTEPHPPATSNDQAVNKEGETQSTLSHSEPVKAATEDEGANGKSELQETAKDGENGVTKPVDYDRKKLRTYEDGVLKTSAQESPYGKNNSKYDPSVLPETDDPKKIRAQV